MADLSQPKGSTPENMRVDKWLWAARFFKTRADAQRLITSGRLRLDGETMAKPHRNIRPGHVLTFPKAEDIRVIKILALARRRGPAPEAALLYEDLAPPQPKSRAMSNKPAPFEQRDRGSGRPTKRERPRNPVVDSPVVEARMQFISTRIHRLTVVKVCGRIVLDHQVVPPRRPRRPPVERRSNARHREVLREGELPVVEGGLTLAGAEEI